MVQVFKQDSNKINAIEFKDVTFGYDKTNKLLEGLYFSIKKGKTTRISGRIGSGKSTLALLMCGVIPRTITGYLTGDIKINGELLTNKELYESAKKISMVFQEPEKQLFSDSVINEIAFAPENLCYIKEEILDTIDKSILKVGMKKYLFSNINTLSGGEKQLIALSSILALDPDIIILDEVGSQIDKWGIELIRKAIIKLQKNKKTIIIIEHNEDFRDLCDEFLILEDKKIKVEEHYE